MPKDLPHLKIDRFFNKKKYTYPTPVVTKFKIPERDRAIHGNKIIQQLNKIKEQFNINAAEELPANIVRDDALYVEFFSDWDFSLKFESLTQERDNPNFQIVNIKKETVHNDGVDKERYKVVVMMKEGGVSTFLKKAGEYITNNTKDSGGNATAIPSHQPLIQSIQDIELATLKSFWSDEPEIPFPSENEDLWWEVWFRKTNNDFLRLQNVYLNLDAIGAQISIQTLNFHEHTVKLIKASALQLSGSLLLLDNLAELRKPQQLNDFITTRNIDIAEKQMWSEDLISRTESIRGDNHVVICLLDSGVNNKHPLLSSILPDNRLYTYKSSWGTEDSWEDGGHGTGMAGLALYGDLTIALEQTTNIKIYHGLESFKIINSNDPTDPELYGALTEYACSVPYVAFPNNPRIFCLAITDKNLAFNGRPSAWSAAIDKISYGEDFDTKLFIISGGNVDYMQPHLNANSYPVLNQIESIHDPSQSYNALTVGSYTRMDRIDQNVWAGAAPLAPSGGISPSNSTSLIWESQWPIKPDIVMEGGNLGVRQGVIMDNITTLKPLSLDKEFNNYIFSPFGDTSGAAALASKLAAELLTAHPQLWPETIKALLVHSAEWTETMLDGIDFQNASVEQKRVLLRTFGYGVPIPEKAFYSANNSLTLIAENYIQPYTVQSSAAKTNEYHLYNIPWPVDVLQNLLADKDVKLKVTLSYFIDPNPGNKRYAYNFSYHSHSLDFKMIRPTETLDEFTRRISATDNTNEVPYQGQDEPWALKEKMRSKGSIKKDFLISSGADLATRNIIAIYPKRGWYISRKILGMAQSKVRYSLIVSIESEESEIDIYTPIVELIENSVYST